jgi:hypothetical protein
VCLGKRDDVLIAWWNSSPPRMQRLSGNEPLPQARVPSVKQRWIASQALSVWARNRSSQRSSMVATKASTSLSEVACRSARISSWSMANSTPLHPTAASSTPVSRPADQPRELRG